MITRRSLLTGVAAAAVAPVLLPLPAKTVHVLEPLGPIHIGPVKHVSVRYVVSFMAGDPDPSEPGRAAA